MPNIRVLGAFVNWEQVVRHRLVRKLVNEGRKRVHCAVSDDHGGAWSRRVGRFLYQDMNYMHGRQAITRTHRPFRVVLLIFVQISLYHEREDLGHKIRVGNFVCTGCIAPSKLRAPATAIFRRRRCSC